MSASSPTAQNDTTAVRESHRFDEARLAAWMAAAVPEFEGPLTVRQFKGGQSNPTYQLHTPSRTYVLRRRPLGPLVQQPCTTCELQGEPLIRVV